MLNLRFILSNFALLAFFACSNLFGVVQEQDPEETLQLQVFAHHVLEKQLMLDRGARLQALHPLESVAVYGIAIGLAVYCIPQALSWLYEQGIIHTDLVINNHNVQDALNGALFNRAFNMTPEWAFFSILCGFGAGCLGDYALRDHLKRDVSSSVLEYVVKEYSEKRESIPDRYSRVFDPLLARYKTQGKINLSDEAAWNLIQFFLNEGKPKTPTA